MHQLNHKEEDFFDILGRPEGVVPKIQNFEATPPDKTRSNISYTPPKPTLNLGKSLGEPRKSSVSTMPLTDQEMSEIAMGLVTPFGGTVRTLEAGAKLLPKIQRGDFEVYKGSKLFRDAKQMPDLTNQGGIRRIIEGGKNKIVESVTPRGMSASGGNKAKHNYQLRALDDFSGKRSENIAEIKFNMSDRITPEGKPYKLITDIATFTPKGTSRDYGKLLSILIKRMGNKWAIKEDDASLDALYGMTKTWLKKAADVEFVKGDKQRFFVPTDRFAQSTWIKNNSPFARVVAGASEENLPKVIDDLARKVTTEWTKSGKISGELHGLFEGKVLTVGMDGRSVGALESNPFYIKAFKERLAALVGMNESQFDKYLEKDLDEE